MSKREEEQLRLRLHDLKDEHQDLDAAIASMSEQAIFDQLRMQRMKKRKLQLKDEIARIEDYLEPDIIA